MSFKFNFGVSDDGENVTEANMIVDETNESGPAAVVEVYKEINLKIPPVSSLIVDSIYYGEHQLWRRRIDDVQFQLAQADEMVPEKSGPIHELMMQGNTTDVVKGVYEGGLKTWECSIDLLNYLVNHTSEIFDSSNSIRVLEIGCGTALPSLHIIRNHNNAQVFMQDYNKDVLELVTIPNVLANTITSPENICPGDNIQNENGTETCELDLDFRRTNALFGDKVDEIVGSRDVPELTREEIAEADNRLLASSDIKHRCKFIAGDWGCVVQELDRSNNNNTFDLILTSETIYDTSSYKRLHDLLLTALSKPSTSSSFERKPLILVAAKSIYFGLSGSTLTFKQYVENQGIFNVSSAWQSGGSMNREILALTWA